MLLTSEDVPNEKLSEYLSDQLDSLLVTRKRRNNQEFYILWLIISGLTYTMIKDNRDLLRIEIQKIISFFRDITEMTHEDGKATEKLLDTIIDIRSMFLCSDRKLRLTQEQKHDLLKLQQNKCAISGKDLFITDDVHADHIVPLTKGGEDVIENIQLVHSDENLKKYNNH